MKKTKNLFLGCFSCGNRLKMEGIAPFSLENLCLNEMLGSSDQFGSLYRSTLEGNSITFGVKKLNQNVEIRVEEDVLKKHMEMLAKLRDPLIVSLYGYSFNKKDKLLFYDFMPNGTLRSRIDENRVDRSALSIIAQRVAQGLNLIHTFSSDPPIFHGNLTSNNIIFDSDDLPRLINYGFAMFTSPESQGVIASKIDDVYPFGIILLEICTGLDNSVNIPNLIQSKMEEVADEIYALNWMEEIIKPELLRFDDESLDVQEKTKNELFNLLALGFDCTSAPDQRPDISTVVHRLYPIDLY